MIGSSQRVAFLVDAPTSRSKVAASFVDTIKAAVENSKLENWSMVLTCGARMDYLSTLQSKLQATWSASTGITSFVCLVTAGTDSQSAKRKNKFLLLVHSAKASTTMPAVPAVLPALKGKAYGWEGLRLRCLSLSCGLRCAEERARAEQLSADAKADPKLAASLPRNEINKDDDEVAEDVEDAQDETDEEDEYIDIKLGDHDRDYIVDVFTFGRSLSYYESIFSYLVGPAVATVIFSATSHPSSSVAARKLGQEVFFVTPQAKEHSDRHGLQLQQQIFKRMYFKSAGMVPCSMNLPLTVDC